MQTANTYIYIYININIKKMMIGKFSKKEQKKKQQHNEALFLIQTVSKH